MSSLLEQTQDFLKRNRASRAQLIGTDFMPDLAPDTRTADPQGIGEKVASFFGFYDPKIKLKSILNEREREAGIYRRQLDALANAQSEEAKENARDTRAVTRAEDALDLKSVLQNEIELQSQLGDIASRLQREAGDISTDQSIKQMQALYPYLDAAGQKAIERNLDASMRFKAFKEQLPSSIQAIMESKQRQQDLASSAFAREAGAIATQQQAATGFAGVGTGRRFG